MLDRIFHNLWMLCKILLVICLRVWCLMFLSSVGSLFLNTFKPLRLNMTFLFR
ncbi:hypothetical protein SAMN05216245_11041 [Succiniclasticum ruminis DSM 9236]|uniref:Uncharacterized protein n=1 Tax=Succiniclasticum ruminis DSM 9236 TaxID=1123323 RepID=A0A1I2BWZ5_9FIRM|nr:hypothetical protein SAMN05216245_11041 [Succiniclasticum ruminis DSM 9236]